MNTYIHLILATVIILHQFLKNNLPADEAFVNNGFWKAEEVFLG